MFTSIQADCGVYGGWPFLSFQYLMQQVKDFTANQKTSNGEMIY